MAQHVRISEQRQGSRGTKFPQKQVNRRAVQRFALRAYKERPTGRFHPDAFFQPSVDGSKFVAGCVVDNPPFNRATCSTRLCMSTWSSLIAQTSDTRRPCRNIRSKRQRSRTSFLLPFVASINRSTSRAVRCLRWLASLSPLGSVPRFFTFSPLHVLSTVGL